jgi:hypothetical protein
MCEEVKCLHRKYRAWQNQENIDTVKQEVAFILSVSIYKAPTKCQQLARSQEKPTMASAFLERGGCGRWAWIIFIFSQFQSPGHRDEIPERFFNCVCENQRKSA